MTFTPSPLLGARRTILAEVSQNGSPREDDKVARYTVAAPPPLPPATALKARRTGSLLRIQWHRIAGAYSYAVTVALSGGSRRFVQVTHPDAVIPAFPTGTGATVTVRGLAHSLRVRLGRPASVKVATTKRTRAVRVKPV